MSAEGALLRTLLLPSLLDVARFNAARGRGELRLFEAGPVYRRRTGEEVAANGGDPRAAREGDPDPDRDRDEPAGPVAERRHLALVLAGPVRPPTWREPRPPEADLFAAKGLLGAVLDELHVPWAVRAQPEPEPFLHPGRAADVLLDGEPAGWLGELHPSVAASWDLGRVACLEVDLDRVLTLAAGVVRRYEDVTSFPAVRQDIAVALADDVPAADAVAVVRRAGGPELRGVDVFDVYAGEQVGPGRRSLALRLEFRAPDRTLTDEEVAGRRRAIERALAEELGGALRG
jgi:phenylalanyl-tRNA synthetase beta chain